MKLSIIVITANPTEKQYAWKEAIASYVAQADEVIIVDGGTEPIVYPDTKVRVIYEKDPEVWNWAEHAKRLNRGLAEATGDWIIKADIDWVFHESLHQDLRKELIQIDTLVATMQKKTFYPGKKYIQKGQIPMIINGKYKKTIRFGKDGSKYTDLTYPITWDGEVDEHGVPVGKLITEKDWGKTGIDFWNFDYTFSTIEQMKRKWLRMSQSHKVYFGETPWGDTEDEALEKFLNNMRGKLSHSLDIIDISVIPKYIRGRIKNLQPEEFGYNGWGKV